MEQNTLFIMMSFYLVQKFYDSQQNLLIDTKIYEENLK